MNRISIAILLAASSTLAQEPAPAPAPATPPPAVEPAPAPAAPVETVAAPAPSKPDRGDFLLGVKAGGMIPQAFSDLGFWGYFEAEVGWILPWLHHGLAVTVSGAYSQPEVTKSATDPRVTSNGGMYSWDLTQRQVIIGLTLFYRIGMIGEGRFVPYLGVGPRLWLLQTQVVGSAGAGNPISESDEQSTKVGVGVPIGFDYKIGPGRVFIEAQLLWAPIDHRTTGDSSVGAITVGAGYRLTL